MQDQIAIFAQEQGTETHPRDVSKVLNELPVEVQRERNAVLDSVAEREDSADVGGTKKILAYTTAILGAVMLTMVVGFIILFYMR